MPTKDEYEAGYVAAKVIADAEISEVEKTIPVFVRPQAERQIEAHRAEIEKTVRAMSDAAVRAAEETRNKGEDHGEEAQGQAEA